MSFYETRKTRIEILSRMPAESRRDLSFEAPSWKKRCHQIYAYKTFNLCIFMRFDAVRIFMYFMRFELNLWIGPVRFAFLSAMVAKKVKSPPLLKKIDISKISKTTLSKIVPTRFRIIQLSFLDRVDHRVPLKMM